tara:strand:+ start:9478 stop:10374 length:897 start_codon:yes stop_codon:yes gene_type:complete
MITGGAGFIGTHLASKLKSIGHKVVLCDFDERFREYHHSNFKCVSCDITNYESVSKLPKCDVIYHFAAQVGTLGALDNLNFDLKCNAEGTLNISKFAAMNNVKTMIYSSSMAVYGENENAKETDLLQPVSPYGISKMCGEHYVRFCNQLSPTMQCVTYRIFNCYGPHQDTKNLTQGLVSIFLNQAINKDVIEVKGSLDRFRDLVHIDDVVNAMLLPLENKSVKGTYNVCTGTKTTLRELIQLIQKVTKRPVKAENIGGHSGDPHGVGGNNLKLTQHGWHPQVNIKRGIIECFEALINE